jgi:hypothetical protein
MPRDNKKNEQQKSSKGTKAGRSRIRDRNAGGTRKQRRHERNISRAAEDRTKDTFQVPMNAEVELASLPPKARTKVANALPEEIHVNRNFTTGTGDDERPIMVPDPMRGKFLKGGALKVKLEAREESARRINKKQMQRRKFASLSPAQKYERRAAGREHRKPSRTK